MVLNGFLRRKGYLAISIGSYGIGSVVFKYINGAILESGGVMQTFLVWGVIVYCHDGSGLILN